jgi:hypothetical protein
MVVILPENLVAQEVVDKTLQKILKGFVIQPEQSL